MSNLDDLTQIKAIDPDNMYGAIAGLPEQIRKAVAIGESVNLAINRYRGVTNIIICGMGGSAIGGDLARSLLADSLSAPIHICRNYRLPQFADKKSLVIGSSYSGNTEETLAAFDTAMTKQCRLLVMTTGGKLGEIASEHKLPMAKLPTGLQPRAALGFSFVPLMVMFHKLGYSPFPPADFLALADFLENRLPLLGVEKPSDDNPAKQLAMKLYGRIPIIYSGPDLTDAVAIRLKGQISENGKMLAFANQFPEFNHNELVGWKVIAAFRDFLRVIMIRDSEDNPRVAARMEIVKKLITDEKVDVYELHSDGKSRLERMFSLIQLGDFASFYLAVLNKVDPTPVKAIDTLKNELARIQ